MTVLFRMSAAGAIALALSACAAVEGETDGPRTTTSGAYKALGTKGVTPEQAEWLSRSHARPAGR